MYFYENDRIDYGLMKTLIVVSGGDAPGINVALYNLTKLSKETDNSILGVHGAFSGILKENFVSLNASDLAAYVGIGGTFLASSREPVLRDEKNRREIVHILKKYAIDNIILLGGDGTLRAIPPILAEHGIACIGIPTTIDNNVPGTEKTIGFASACSFAHQTIDGLLATARALPKRVFSVEVLGGDSGFIALDVAYASNAHAVLMPEFTSHLEHVASQLKSGIENDGWGLLVLSEGIADKDETLSQLENAVGMKIRNTKLGHGQRGCLPSHADRFLAKQLSTIAYQALQNGETFGTCLVQEGQAVFNSQLCSDFPKRIPDKNLFREINVLEEMDSHD